MPKLSGFRTWQFNANVYNYTVTTDGGASPVLHYFFLRNVNVDISQGIFGKITVFFRDSEADVMNSAQLFQLRDRSGKEIFPSAIWTIQGLQPVINIFGQREGFRANATVTGVTAAAGS